MRKRLGAGLLCAAAAGLIALGGCMGTRQEAPEAVVNLPVNDGSLAKLTIAIEVRESSALASKSGAFTRELSEIIAKYQADFPNTEIEITEDVQGELIAAGGSEAPDIELFTGADMYSRDEYPRDTDWLMDLTQYADAWSEEGSISNPASLIMHFMGGDSIYAIPCQYDQMMLYYRSDRFEEYNEGLPYNEQVGVNLWGQVLDVGDKLGDQGRLVIDKRVKPYLFDTFLWGWTDTKLIADMSAAYYQKDGSTIFTLEPAVNGVNALKRLLDTETESDDPMQDFIDGRACIYIGTGLDMRELRDKMPGEAGTDWCAAGMPQGTYGKVVPLLSWSAWGVNKDTKEPDKAVHFLWYLTNADNSTHMSVELMDGGVKPIYREAEAYEPALLESCWSVEIGLLNKPKYSYASAMLMPGEETGIRNKVFSELLEGLGNGGTTPEEMLKGLDQEYTRLLDEYRAGGNELPWQRDSKEDKE